MRKVFATLLLIFLSTNSSIAIQGDCSWHGGINCPAGADYPDGSVICNDGWKDSKDSYYDALECKIANQELGEKLKNEVSEMSAKLDVILDEFKEFARIETGKTEAKINTFYGGDCSGAKGRYKSVNLKTVISGNTDTLSNELENTRANMMKIRGEFPLLKWLIISGGIGRNIPSANDLTLAAVNEKYYYGKRLVSSIEKVLTEKLNGLDQYMSSCQSGKDQVQIASSKLLQFSDAEESQFRNAITFLKDRGSVNGYIDGTFKPFNPINRAEFMKIVIGAAEIEPSGKNCFSDIGEEWFAPYVCAGMANGIVGGYSDGSFKPEQQINVAEALKITLKAFGIQAREANNSETWYAPFTEYARSNDYYLDTFNSDDKQLTREDMAELVYRIMP